MPAAPGSVTALNNRCCRCATGYHESVLADGFYQCCSDTDASPSIIPSGWAWKYSSAHASHYLVGQYLTDTSDEKIYLISAGEGAYKLRDYQDAGGC
jgi:hypothetical protein